MIPRRTVRGLTIALFYTLETSGFSVAIVQLRYRPKAPTLVFFARTRVSRLRALSVEGSSTYTRND